MLGYTIIKTKELQRSADQLKSLRNENLVLSEKLKNQSYAISKRDKSIAMLKNELNEANESLRAASRDILGQKNRINDFEYVRQNYENRINKLEADKQQIDQESVRASQSVLTPEALTDLLCDGEESPDETPKTVPFKRSKKVAHKKL